MIGPELFSVENKALVEAFRIFLKLLDSPVELGLNYPRIQIGNEHIYAAGGLIIDGKDVGEDTVLALLRIYRALICWLPKELKLLAFTTSFSDRVVDS